MAVAGGGGDGVKLTIGPLEVLALRSWLEGRKGGRRMFSLKIETDNAAFFEDDGDATPEALGAELGRILRAVASHVENGGTVGGCVDANGNSVGEWEVSS